jgi:hypothetical protein
VREKVVEGHIALEMGEISQLVEQFECFVLWTCGQCAVAKACVGTTDVLERRVRVMKEAEQFGRATVDKLGAEFYRGIGFVGMQSEDAAADAVACFEYGDATA